MPTGLKELVPEYLPSSMADPYSPDDAPFVYKRNPEFPHLSTVGDLFRATPKFYLHGKPPKKRAAIRASRPE